MAGLNTLFSVLLNKYNPSQWGYFQQNKFQDFRNCIKFSTDAQDSLDITSFSIEITFSVLLSPAPGNVHTDRGISKDLKWCSKRFWDSSSLLHIVTSDTSLVYSNLPAMNFVPIKTRVLSTSPSRLSPPLNCKDIKQRRKTIKKILLNVSS